MELIKRNLIYMFSLDVYRATPWIFLCRIYGREESLVVVQDREAADTASTICIGQAIPAAAE
jgi:hypothetical protein